MGNNELGVLRDPVNGDQVNLSIRFEQGPDNKVEVDGKQLLLTALPVLGEAECSYSLESKDGTVKKTGVATNRESVSLNLNGKVVVQSLSCITKPSKTVNVAPLFRRPDRSITFTDCSSPFTIIARQSNLRMEAQVDVIVGGKIVHSHLWLLPTTRPEITIGPFEGACTLTLRDLR